MKRPHGFARDARGGTALEFTLIFPVLMLLLMGMGELCYEAYVRAILVGALQKAGRDSAIQGGGDLAATIDGKVIATVRTIAHSVTYVSSRKNYDQFGYIGAAEPFVDANGNNKYDAATECFTDLNANKVWDADSSAAGQGGASDVTVYTITITYPRLFPVAALLGWPAAQTASATSILKNQPYATQTASSTVCPT